MILNPDDLPDLSSRELKSFHDKVFNEDNPDADSTIYENLFEVISFIYYD